MVSEAQPLETELSIGRADTSRLSGGGPGLVWHGDTLN